MLFTLEELEEAVLDVLEDLEADRENPNYDRVFNKLSTLRHLLQASRNMAPVMESLVNR